MGSVFTHLLPDVVEAYLREIPRVLSPRGTCVASCYLLNDDTRLGVDSNRSFMSFPVLHLSGLCRLHDVGVPEAAVALEERFVRDAVGAAGRCVSDARRGRWAFGVPHEQDVLTIAHEPGALMER